MLEKIRDGAQGPAAKIVLGLVILSFALAGIGSYLRSPSEPVVAKINGTKITKTQFERAYQNQRAQMEQQGNARLNDDAYLAQLKRSVLEQLINTELLNQAADKVGLTVSDGQIARYIHSIPAFQEDGQFSVEQFKKILGANNMNPQQFKANVRAQLAQQQLTGAITETSFALPNEAKQAYQLIDQQRQVAYWQIPAEQFAKQITPTEQEIHDYYDSHVSDYQVPEKVKLSYIELNQETLAKSIADPDDATIQQYYEDNIAQYQRPERRKLAHIQLTGDDAKQQADKIEQQLNDGQSFAELAKKYSEDSYSGKNGGDLGWFTNGDDFPESFSKAAFALAKPGDVSTPVKTDYGYHIIKLEALEPAKTSPLSKVRDDVIAAVKKQQANDKFYELRPKLVNSAYEEPDSLAHAADVTTLPVKHTELFSAAKAPTLFKEPKLADAIFDQELIASHSNSEPVEVAPGHVVVFHVDDYEEAHAQPFDEVEGQVKTALVNERATQQANELAKQLVSDLKDGKAITDHYQDAVVNAHSKVWLHRNAQQYPQAIVDTAFSMSPSEEDAPQWRTAALDDGAAAIALYGIKTVDLDAHKDELKILTGRLTDRQQQVSNQLLIAALRSNADIEYLERNE